MNKTVCFHDHLISTFPNNQLKCSNQELNEIFNKKCNNDFNFQYDTLKNLLSNMIDTSILYRNTDEFFNLRKKTILMMKRITKEFDLCDKTFHLALALLDRISIILIKNKNALLQIKSIGKFCIILSTKFIEDKTYKVIELEKKYLKKISFNFINDEIYILQLLNYNLNTTTSYDILTFLLTNQEIIFEDEENLFLKKNKIYSIYHMSIVYINKLVENNITLIMTPVQIAFGVIQIIRKRLGLIPNRNELYNKFHLKLYIEQINFSYNIFYNIFCNNSKSIIEKNEIKGKNENENPNYKFKVNVNVDNNNNYRVLCD
jgi:hypothetical protein